ncbi:SGNH hydrolase-type esterase domain-containing protein [Dendryphion nanum]|uniref:SGNH hydrolase-type esterase domain-containing protein n=1 Tax=Dendryphion nanum TaxID=256645 RepID=A0A9P9DNI3_9PLEO|nr:SGNH hydrolase-type esterase domain-containing protein [Dendryphion nanum]
MAFQPTHTLPNQQPTILSLPDDTFFPLLQIHSKPKPRSSTTYTTIHLPELNKRLSLNLSLPNLTSTSPMTTIYIGNSMLERLKTTGSTTRLATYAQSWNAGCGGDKNENVLFRFDSGMYSILKTANPNKDIRVWVLASGTNNLHPKHGLREKDVQSWRVLVETCLRIAPRSRVVACDLFYRLDVGDEVVERANEMLERVVGEVNEELGEERVVWVCARGVVGKDMLVDHVHLDEKGYAVWDGVLWPVVEELLGKDDVVVEREEKEGTEQE